MSKVSATGDRHGTDAKVLQAFDRHGYLCWRKLEYHLSLFIVNLLLNSFTYETVMKYT